MKREAIYKKDGLKYNGKFQYAFLSASNTLFLTHVASL